MTSLSAQTLMMAIQGVDAEMNRLTAECGSVAEMEPDDQELYLAFSKAAEELKRAYLDAARAYPTLPPYDDLVAGGH